LFWPDPKITTIILLGTDFDIRSTSWSFISVSASRKTFCTHGPWCKILHGLVWMKLWNRCWVVGQLTS
jgi:hypothetical protein